MGRTSSIAKLENTSILKKVAVVIRIYKVVLEIKDLNFNNFAAYCKSINAIMSGHLYAYKIQTKSAKESYMNSLKYSFVLRIIIN